MPTLAELLTSSAAASGGGLSREDVLGIIEGQRENRQARERASRLQRSRRANKSRLRNRLPPFFRRRIQQDLSNYDEVVSDYISSLVSNSGVDFTSAGDNPSALELASTPEELNRLTQLSAIDWFVENRGMAPSQAAFLRRVVEGQNPSSVASLSNRELIEQAGQPAQSPQGPPSPQAPSPPVQRRGGQAQVRQAAQATLSGQPPPTQPGGPQAVTQGAISRQAVAEPSAGVGIEDTLAGRIEAQRQVLMDLQANRQAFRNEIFNRVLGNIEGLREDVFSRIQAPTVNEATRQNVANAIIERLSPQFQKRRERLLTRLANRGIPRGSEAFQAAMATFNRGINDASLAAQIAASEQARAQLQSQLAAQQQQFQQRRQAIGQRFALPRAGLEQRFAARNRALQTLYGLPRTGAAQRFSQLARVREAELGRQLSQEELELRARANALQARAARGRASARASQTALGQRQLEAEIRQARRRAARAGSQQQFNQSLALNQFLTGSTQDVLGNRFNRGLTANQTNIGNQQLARSFPLTRAGSLFNMTGFNLPSPVSTPAVSVSGPPTASVMSQQSQQLQNQALQTANAYRGLYKGLAQLGGSGAVAAAAFLSDRRLKRNIRKIGSYKGHNLYTYEFVWGEPSAGVMAQEVMETRPDAVITGTHGYLMVDYSCL